MPRWINRRWRERCAQNAPLGGKAVRDLYGLEYMREIGRRGSQKAAELRAAQPHRVRRECWLPIATEAALVAHAEECGMSVSALMRHLLVSYFEPPSKPGGRRRSGG